MIVLSNVSKIFNSNSGQVLAVDAVNLQIQTGQIYGIVGYSGAGKSTLIRLFNGLEQPTSGSILIAGNDISSAKGNALRQARLNISMVFQHFNLLWSRTVSENIAFSLEIAGASKTQIKNRVAELIALVGLQGRENAYPSQLSGGQKQRVGIARALANNPKVLLCDEATSALDPQTTDAILDLLLDINHKLNLTIVLITHEMHVVRKICHRVAVMENGKINGKIIMRDAVAEEGRILSIFEKAGVITLKPGVSKVDARISDVVENPKHLKFQANVEGALLPQIYNNNEGDAVVINANYAIDAGLNPTKDPIAVESGEDNPYANIITVHKDDVNKPEIKALVNVLHSKEIQDFIREKYQGAVIPVNQ